MAELAPAGNVAAPPVNVRARWLQNAFANPLANVLLAAFATRVYFVIVGIVSAAQVVEWPAGTWNRGPAWVQPFARWDSGYYLDIAAQGYGDRLALWAFHPGYPLVIRAATTLVPGLAPEVAGFLISNASFLVAIALFHRLTSRALGPAMAMRSSMVLALFPSTFYFTAIYPESLFFLMLVPALDAFHQERWVAAGWWAAAANAVRPQGLFLAPAFAAVLLWHRYHGRDVPVRAWLAPAIGLSFVATFSVYAWQMTGDPWIWLAAREQVWTDVGWHDPFTTIWRSFTQVDNHGLSVVGLALLLGGATYGLRQTWARIAPATLAAHAFTGILLFVHVIYAATPSLLRYCLASFSVVWLLAHLGRTRAGFALVLTASAALATYVAHLFSIWGPAF